MFYMYYKRREKCGNYITPGKQHFTRLILIQMVYKSIWKN